MHSATSLALTIALAVAPGTTAVVAQDPGGAVPTVETSEQIGSWLLVCSDDRMTDRTDCRLLHRQPVQPASPGFATLALEVLDRGGQLVPAVTARNLTIEGAGSGLLALTGAVQLRFPPERVLDMPCGLEGRSVICAPRPEDARRVAAELPGAERSLLCVNGLLSRDGDRAEPVELHLMRTGEALARLRTRLPEGGAAPPTPLALDLREMLGRLLRFLVP